MVFLFDDVLEGITLVEVATFIGTTLFGEAEAASAVEGTSLVVQDLLGDDGLEAVIDLAKNETTVPMGSNITNEILEQNAEQLWEEGGMINVNGMTKEGFIDRAKVIGQRLINNGADMTSNEGKQLLRNITNKAFELGKKGIKRTINPEILVSTALGAVGGGKIFANLQGKRVKPHNKISFRRDVSAEQSKLFSNLPI